MLPYAREERSDLVLAGAHGRTGMPRFVLGSVAERVARQTPCAVLVARDHTLVEEEAIADEAECTVVVVRGRISRPADRLPPR